MPSRRERLALGAIATCVAGAAVVYLVRRIRALEEELRSLKAGAEKPEDPKRELQTGGPDGAKKASKVAGHKQTVGVLDASSPENGPSVFEMEEIGVIVSNFPHRAGTPRQGTM